MISLEQTICKLVEILSDERERSETLLDDNIVLQDEIISLKTDNMELEQRVEQQRVEIERLKREIRIMKEDSKENKLCDSDLIRLAEWCEENKAHILNNPYTYLVPLNKASMLRKGVILDTIYAKSV